MNIYIYTKSGHNFGLDRVRRGAVLYKLLEQKGCEPILCTSDYRAATFARELGVYRGVGIDIIENLPNLMERSDMLIFDSDEPSETMLSFMDEYCTHLYQVGKDIPLQIVDDKYFTQKDQPSLDKKVFFFGDDDYHDLLLKLSNGCDKQDISLLMGHYFFLGNEDKLAPYFNNVIDEDEYYETISSTKYLLSSSINTVFESLASGNLPIFYKREDKDENIDILKQYNIPIIEASNLSETISKFEDITSNYPQIKPLEKVDISDILNEISLVIEKFKTISKSLDANY